MKVTGPAGGSGANQNVWSTLRSPPLPPCWASTSCMLSAAAAGPRARMPSRTETRRPSGYSTPNSSWSSRGNSRPGRGKGLTSANRPSPARPGGVRRRRTDRVNLNPVEYASTWATPPRRRRSVRAGGDPDTGRELVSGGDISRCHHRSAQASVAPRPSLPIHGVHGPILPRERARAHLPGRMPGCDRRGSMGSRRRGTSPRSPAWRRLRWTSREGHLWTQPRSRDGSVHVTDERFNTVSHLFAACFALVGAALLIAQAGA